MSRPALNHPPALEAAHVSKRYPSHGLLRRLSRTPRMPEPDALHDVSFDVQPGEMVGLLGPNGAGKTTLLKIASGMLYPSSGSVRIGGEDIASNSAAARRRIGLVTSDERSFYWRLTGRQNLEFFATLYDVPRDTSTQRIAMLFDHLGLAHAADKPFYAYSSGMKQKMAIGRGLLAAPSVVLYDEPTRALDPLSTRTIRQWLKDNQRQSPATAHLIATNQMDEAEQLCDRLIILNRGRIVASGTSREIRARFQEHAVHRIAFRGIERPDFPRKDAALGVLDVAMESAGDCVELRVHTAKGGAGLSAVLGWILADGGVVLSCQTVEISLEEVICSIVLGDQPAVAPEEAVVR